MKFPQAEDDFAIFDSMDDCDEGFNCADDSRELDPCRLDGLDCTTDKGVDCSDDPCDECLDCVDDPFDNCTDTCA